MQYKCVYEAEFVRFQCGKRVCTQMKIYMPNGTHTHTHTNRMMIAFECRIKHRRGRRFALLSHTLRFTCMLYVCSCNTIDSMSKDAVA